MDAEERDALRVLKAELEMMNQQLLAIREGLDNLNRTDARALEGELWGPDWYWRQGPYWSARDFSYWRGLAHWRNPGF